LELKNIILEAKLFKKLKKGNEKFLTRMASLSISELYGLSISKQEIPKPWKPFRLKNFMTIFVFVAQFFFPNCVLKLQEVFSEHGIRLFFENRLGSFNFNLFFKKMP
jgi:hypothetical protein